jgi:hypothetical protein
MTYRDNEPIIDSDDHDALIVPEGMSRGHKPRDYDADPLGCLKAAPKFDLKIPPRSEWPALIKAREESKSRISDRLIAAGIPCLNQNGTSNCWANAPTHCIEILRCLQGLPYVPLSPAFIATTLGEYGGGMGLDALEVIAEKGVPPCELFPANANRHAITDEILKAAAHYRVIEWWDMPSTFDAMAAAILLLDTPCALGYNWWSHEVTGCDITYDGSRFGVRIRNSWGMDYGDGKGFAVLMEGKGTPDDCCSPRTALPYSGK